MAPAAVAPVCFEATARCARCRGPHATAECRAPFLRQTCSSAGCVRGVAFVSMQKEEAFCGPCHRLRGDIRRKEAEERCEKARRQLVCATFPEGSKAAHVEAAMRDYFAGCGVRPETCKSEHKLGMSGIATFADEASAQTALAWAREARGKRLFFSGKHVCVFAREGDEDGRSTTSLSTAPSLAPSASTACTRAVTEVAESEFLAEDLKEVRKWEKKLRELVALAARKAAGETLQANQEEKLGSKDDVETKLRSARAMAQVRAARA